MAAKKSAAAKEAAGQENNKEVSEVKSEKKETKSKKKSAAVTAKEEAAAVSLSSLTKADVIAKFKRAPSDVGSPEVQVALLTQRLEYLTKHFTTNPKDHHSQRGMMALISKRKQLLQYLRTEDVSRYKKTIDALGIRK